MRNAPTPVSGIADLLVSILERGIVLVLRLDGPPGDRRLLLGFGTPDSVEALLLALGATHVFGRSHYESAFEDDWPDYQ